MTNECQVDGLTAQSLNDHYAAVSTDTLYQPTTRKSTVQNHGHWITEMEFFRILDCLRPTAAGLDGLPVWFLRIAAPIFAAPY